MGKTKLAVLVTLVAVSALAATAEVAATNRLSSISLGTTKLGKVLVAANGHTLYLFTADKGKTGACYGQCAGYWPPLIAQKPTAGHPLYFFAEDKRPGDVNGQGFVHFGGTWWVISAAGTKVTVKP